MFRWIFPKLSFLSLHFPHHSFLSCFSLCLTFSILYFFTSLVFVSLFSILYSFTSVFPNSLPFSFPPCIPSISSIILSFRLHFSNYPPFFPSFLYFLCSLFPFSSFSCLQLDFSSNFTFFLYIYTNPTTFKLKGWSHYGEEGKGQRDN